MTCRHGKNDPSCSSSQYYRDSEPAKPTYTSAYSSTYVTTPDKTRFEWEMVEQVGNHLVAKIKYPNCAACSYEGNKIVIFLNCTYQQALRWKEIDPHFAKRDTKRIPTQAPPPAARFPADAEGWTDAMAYAKSKIGGK